jgi:PAS domain S-box-containing protein
MVVRNLGDGPEQTFDAALFRVVFEQNAMGMALRAVDPRGSLWLDVNDKFCDIFGYTREKLLQMTSVELSYPEEQDDAVKYNERLLNGEIESYSREKRYIHKDGHIIWANIWLSVVDGSDGKPGMIISVIEDITVRKREEAALQESDERLKAFIDASPSAILMKDKQGRYLLANKRWNEWFNPEGIDITGKCVHDFHSKEHAAAISVQDQKVLETGRTNELEYETPFADGQVRNTLLQKFPIHDSSGAIVGIGAVNMDITERKEADQALSNAYENLENIIESRTHELTVSRNRMRAIFENAPTELYLKDAEGRYVEVNRRFEELFDVKNQDVIGKFPSEVHGRELGALVRAHDLNILESGKVAVEDQKAMTCMGERILRTVKFPVFDDSQVITGLGAVVTDITELEVARQEAIQANRAKSSFLATMSHEIRTPLNGVLGLAQLLTYTDLDKNQRQKIDTILSSGQTLLAIINDVLDMSKIEAGGIELENSPFSLGDLVSTITTPFQNLADDKGLRLIVRDGGIGKRVIKGDLVRLRQILWNLLSNAIKFTEQGSVTLTIADVDNAHDSIVEAKTHGLHFSIEDTGAGIAKDRIDAIFDSFTQEDSSITRKHGGTGLGLSIVKQLTRLMGGTINAKSQIGEGTVFNVYLPFDAATKDDAESMSLRKVCDSSQKTEPLNVLVAEDNEVNAVIARAFLEKFGHNVQHVENGKLAVEAAKVGWADLILMDVHMPEMNGIDATKAIRLTELGKTLPIIAVTAEAFAERHVLFKEAGMNGVLTKPFTELQLTDTLATHRLLERRSERRSNEPKDTMAASRANADQLEVIELTESDVTETTLSVADRHPPVDEAKFNEFCDMLGSETITILLREAQSSLQKRLGKLREGVSDGDTTQIREAVHAIKGASGSMYAMHVSELAAEIESSATDIGVVQSLMPEFELAAMDVLDWWHKQATKNI